MNIIRPDMQIFISHSSIDKYFVRQLKKELELKHLKVWLDEVDIRVGQSISKEITIALSKTDIFCFIISKGSAQSDWVAREFYSILPVIISGNAYLIPCRIDDTSLPTIIADIKYADFRNEFSIGLNQLLNGVKIKEELELQNLIQKTIENLKSNLNKEEIEYFINHFSNKKWFWISDRREQSAPYNLLGKLEELGILELTSDKYELLYTITEIGLKVHSEFIKYFNSLFNDNSQSNITAQPEKSILDS